MVKKTGFILLLLLAALHVGRPQGAAPTGLAFAQLQDDGQPCPPECVTDSMEIVTWYPSPYNEYEELRLYPISDSNSQCNSDTRGLMYYDSDEDKVKLCKGPAGNNDWQELGGGYNISQNSASAVCDNTTNGMLVFDGSGLKLCVNSQWQSVYSPKIFGSVHSESDCVFITGAKVVTDNNGNKFCQVPQASCPSGWSQHENWSETKSVTCSDWCCQTISGGGSTTVTISCTTGGHVWNNAVKENCYQSMNSNCWPPGSGCSRCNACSYTCYASVSKIGCY